jgi:hypothetical protein
MSHRQQKIPLFGAIFDTIVIPHPDSTYNHRSSSSRIYHTILINKATQYHHIFSFEAFIVP